MTKDSDIKYIDVLRGASDELVTHRELRKAYQTNRNIKTWATYFLLKSFTTSGVIKKWLKQKSNLLAYCKMTENCFRTRLTELKQLQLITISKDKSIILTSFEKAAKILGIKYSGTTKIEYNEHSHGKQVFQFHLVMDEIKNNQEAQLEALNYKINKNPELKNVLLSVMIQDGAVERHLNDKRYFQEYLLKIQKHFFKIGSDIWTIIIQERADINRSVNGLKRHYKFKSAQSASYLKGKLKELGIAHIEKSCVESLVRTRHQIKNHKGQIQDAYKYCRQSKKTVMFLCDAIIPKIKIKAVKSTVDKILC